MARDGVRAWAGEAICGLVLTVVGIGFAVVSRRMPLFEDGVPGPGLAPMMLGLALATLGAGIAIAAMWRRSDDIIQVIDRDSLLATFLLFVAVVAFDSVGFVIATFLFLLSGFVLIGKEPWLTAMLVAGGATGVTWALFVKALGVQLPAGWFGLL